MKYGEKNNLHYYNIIQKNRLAPGCGENGPILGQDGPLTIVAPDSYCTTIHNYRLFVWSTLGFPIIIIIIMAEMAVV